MAPAPELGELQLAVMRVLWRRREATAAEVHAVLEPERGLALTTVATILQRLEKRGLVAHRGGGRAFVYQATVSEPAVRRSALDSLVRSLFAGDPAALVSELLASDDVSPGDEQRIRALIAERTPGRRVRVESPGDRRSGA
jgi:predicted transcriptional regulator